jgi:hypothetical protein
MAELGVEATKITTAAKALPPKEIRDCGGFKKASTRAMDALTKRMPIPPYYRSRHELGWRFLKPVEALPGLIPAQGGVVMMLIGIGALGRPGVSIEPFGIFFSEHSLCRLFDRGGASVDAIREMGEAHHALVRLGTREGGQVFALDDLVVPGATGMWLVSPKRLNGGDLPTAHCRTWIAMGQAYPDQAADVALWNRYLDQDQMAA